MTPQTTFSYNLVVSKLGIDCARRNNGSIKVLGRRIKIIREPKNKRKFIFQDSAKEEALGISRIVGQGEE